MLVKLIQSNVHIISNILMLIRLCRRLAWPPTSGTNRLAVPPVKLTTVANQPGFPGCRPTDVERSTRRRDFRQIVIHLPSAT